jgi:SAM-dependent MidA family methyltransferase
VLGYCNAGALPDELRPADPAWNRRPLPTRKVMAQKLIMEHEMGELFKVIGFAKCG